MTAPLPLLPDHAKAREALIAGEIEAARSLVATLEGAAAAT